MLDPGSTTMPRASPPPPPAMTGEAPALGNDAGARPTAPPPRGVAVAVNGGERTARFCYFLLGAGLLAPWNALLTATDFYQAAFPGKHVERTLTLCYLPTCLLLLTLTAFAPRRFPSPNTRAALAYAGFAALMAGLAAADALLSPAVARVAVVTALVGLFDGVGQGAVFGGVARSMPRSFLHAAIGGTSASGLLLCVLRMLTKAALPATPSGLRWSVVLYYAIAAAISAACWAAQSAVLPRLPVVRRHLREERLQEKQGEARRRSRSAGAEEQRSGGGTAAATWRPSADGAAAEASIELSPKEGNSGDGGGGGGGGGRTLAATAEEQQQQHAVAATAPLLLTSRSSTSCPPLSAVDGGGGGGGGADAPSSADQPPALPQNLALAPPSRPSRALARRALLPCAALASVYVVSLAIFPGVLAEDLSPSAAAASGAPPGGWYPLILFTAYNFGDLSGKAFLPLPKRLARLATDRALLLAAIARGAVFLPVYVAARELHAPAWVVVLVTLALGLTNGYLTFVLMAVVPRRLARAHHHAGGAAEEEEEEEDTDLDAGGGADAEAIENLLVIALMTGLLLGALSSWLWLI